MGRDGAHAAISWLRRSQPTTYSGCHEIQVLRRPNPRRPPKTPKVFLSGRSFSAELSTGKSEAPHFISEFGSPRCTLASASASGRLACLYFKAPRADRSPCQTPSVVDQSLIDTLRVERRLIGAGINSHCQPVVVYALLDGYVGNKPQQVSPPSQILTYRGGLTPKPYKQPTEDYRPNSIFRT
jgi:hypothetical protein